MDIKDIKKLTAKIEVKFYFDVPIIDKDIKTLKDWLTIDNKKIKTDKQEIIESLWFLHSEGDINLLNEKIKFKDFQVNQILECKINE